LDGGEATQDFVSFEIEYKEQTIAVDGLKVLAVYLKKEYT